MRAAGNDRGADGGGSVQDTSKARARSFRVLPEVVYRG